MATIDGYGDASVRFAALTRTTPQPFPTIRTQPIELEMQKHISKHSDLFSALASFAPTLCVLVLCVAMQSGCDKTLDVTQNPPTNSTDRQITNEPLENEAPNDQDLTQQIASTEPSTVAANESQQDAPPDPDPEQTNSSSLASDTEPRSQQPKISAEAFRMAAYEGDLAKVKSAIESGMDANGIDPAQKLSALHMAAYNGHTETVNYLISKGAVVDARDSEKKTPLIHACTGPFAPTVKALIAAGADINATDGTEGFTPLMMAAGLGQAEIVEILLANKVTVDLIDEDQETAIDHARNAGHEAIVTRLETAMSEK
jgi:hypothetical protein